MTDPNSGSFKKGSGKATYEGSPEKQQLSKKALSKGNFQGGSCRRAAFKNDPDNCSFKERLFKEGPTKRSLSRKVLIMGMSKVKWKCLPYPLREFSFISSVTYL